MKLFESLLLQLVVANATAKLIVKNHTEEHYNITTGIYRASVGLQVINVENRPIRIFSKGEESRFCGTNYANFKKHYAESIIIWDNENANPRTCFPEFPNSLKDDNFISRWCTFNSVVVSLTPEPRALGIFMYANSKHEDGLLKDCMILEASYNNETRNLLTEADNQLLFGSISNDFTKCQKTMASTQVAFLFRGVIASSFLFASLFACYVAYDIAKTSRRMGITQLLLGITCLSMLYISVIFSFGSHFLKTSLPWEFVMSIMNFQFGVSIACNYLVAVRWHISKLDILQTTNPLNLFLNRYVVGAISSSLCLMDAYNTYNTINASTLGFVSGVTKVYFFIELVVLAYFSFQVTFALGLLQSIRTRLKISVSLVKSKEDFETAIGIIRETRSMRNWMIISIVSGIFALFLLAVGFPDLAFTDCDVWLSIWAGSAISRVITAISQCKIAHISHRISAASRRKTRRSFRNRHIEVLPDSQ